VRKLIEFDDDTLARLKLLTREAAGKSKKDIASES
jgi:hypothetical protein